MPREGRGLDSLACTRSHAGPALARVACVAWHKVTVSRLELPSTCCRCGADTFARTTFLGRRSGVLRVVEEILGYRRSVVLSVPFCEACARESRSAWLRGTVSGLAVSMAVLSLGVAIAGPRHPESGALVTGLVLAFLACPLLGYLLGRRPDAVEMRDYRPQDHTVEIRFESAAFGSSVLGYDVTDSRAASRSVEAS